MAYQLRIKVCYGVDPPPSLKATVAGIGELRWLVGKVDVRQPAVALYCHRVVRDMLSAKVEHVEGPTPSICAECLVLNESCSPLGRGRRARCSITCTQVQMWISCSRMSHEVRSRDECVGFGNFG